MGFFSAFRLFRACFRLAGTGGLIACFKYLTGALQLDDQDLKSSVFTVGVSDV